jgi:hypothetical protein
MVWTQVERIDGVTKTWSKLINERTSCQSAAGWQCASDDELRVTHRLQFI